MFYNAVRSAVILLTDYATKLHFELQRDKTLQEIIAFTDKRKSLSYSDPEVSKLLGVNYRTLNPSLAAIKTLTLQQSKQQGTQEVDRASSPTPTKASFVSTNNH